MNQTRKDGVPIFPGSVFRPREPDQPKPCEVSDKRPCCPPVRPDLNRLPQLDRHDLVRLFRDLEEDRIATARP